MNSYAVAFNYFPDDEDVAVYLFDTKAEAIKYLSGALKAQRDIDLASHCKSDVRIFISPSGLYGYVKVFDGINVEHSMIARVGSVYNTESDWGTVLDDQLKEVLEHSLVLLTTGQGASKERILQFLGYGYLSEDDGDKPYRWVSHRLFIALLKDVIEGGIVTRHGINYFKYEFDEEYKFRADIEDIDNKTCAGCYFGSQYGYSPAMLNASELNMETPDGIYILM